MNTKNKHTPGPWTYTVYGVYPTIRSDKNHIATLDSECGNNIANANLIAAAAEMFEELEKTARWLRHLEPQIRERMPICVILGFDQAIRSHEEIIRKARGEV